MPPNTSFKTLLVKLGINTSDWKTAVGQIRTELQKLASEEKAKLDAQRAALREQLEQQKQVTTAAKQQTAEIQAQVAAAKLAAAQQQAVYAAAKATSEQQRTTAEQLKLQAQQVKDDLAVKLAQERLVTAEIARQTAALRQQLAEQRASARATTPATVKTSPTLSPAFQAALALRSAQAVNSGMEEGAAATIAARQKIIELVDAESAALRAKDTLTLQEASELSKLLALREQQLKAMQAVTAAQEKEAAATEQEVARAAALAGRAPSPAFQAAINLRTSQAAGFGGPQPSDAATIAAREKILQLVDAETASLRTKETLTNEEAGQLAKLLTLREQQTRAIQQTIDAQAREEAGAKRLQEREAARQAQAQERARRQTPADSTVAQTELSLRLAQGEVLTRKELGAEHQKIVVLLDQEIAALKVQGELNTQQLSQLRRLTAERTREAEMARAGQGGFFSGMFRGAGGGGAGGGGGFGGGGFLGGLGMGGGGTLGMASMMGPQMALGVFAGQQLSNMFESAVGFIENFADKVKEFIVESYPQLQLIEGTFQRLGAMRGYDTVAFLGQLRTATHDLVPDIQLLRMANVAMQSSLKVSQDQISQMVKATVALARAQGQDATVAVQALDRAFLTGRFQALAYVTGITRAELQMKGFGAALGAVGQQQASFDHMLDVLNKKLLTIGDPALTLGDRLKALSNEQQRFFQSVGRSLADSPGFRSFLGLFDELLQYMRGAEERGKGLGTVLGGVFGAAVTVVKGLIDAVKSLIAIFDDLKTVGAALTKDLFGSELEGRYARILDFFVSWKTALFGVGAAFTVIGGEAELLANHIHNAVLYSEALAKARFGDIGKIAEEGEKRSQQIKQESGDRLVKLGIDLNMQKQFQALPKNSLLGKTLGTLGDQKTIDEYYNRHPDERPVEPGKGGPMPGAQPDLQLEARLEKLRVEQMRAMYQQEYDLAKENFQKLTDLTEEEYHNGTTSLAEYVHQRIFIREQELQAQIDMLEKEKKLQLQEVGSQLAHGEITPQEAGIRSAMIKAQTGGKEDVARAQAMREEDALQQKITDDTRKAAEIRAQAVFQAQEKSVQGQEKLQEDYFKSGLIGEQQYMAALKGLYAEELDLFAQQENSKVAMSEKTEAARAQAEVAIQQKQEELAEKERQMEQTLADERIKRAEGQFNKQYQALTDQREGLKAGGQAKIFFPTSDDENAVITQQMTMLFQYIGQLEALRRGVDLNSQAFADLTTEIAKSEKEIVQLQAEMDTNAEHMSKMFGQLSSAFGMFRHTPLGQLFGGAAQMFADRAQFAKEANQEGIGTYKPAMVPFKVTDFQSFMTAPPNQQSPTMKFQATTNPFVAMGQTFKELVKGGKGFGDNLEKFTTSLSGAVKSVGSFVAAMTQSVGGAQGAFAGGVSGVGLGGDVGGAVGKLFGLGAMAGPIGAVVGGIGGAIFGGIIGAKKKQTEKIAQQMEQNFQAIVAQFQLQQQTLSQTIQQLIAQRDATIAALSHQKGGQDQLNQILPQMNNEITQLQSQQAQVLQQMAEQLDILRSPLQFQGYMQTLQQILDQYKQFSGAASSAQQLADANNFLALSLQNFAQTSTQDLQQSELQAIQDAIQLNDLLTQRAQLLTDTNTQEYQIMSQGLVGRQLTFGQTKMDQMQVLEQQRNLQLQQIDEQIALAQYKVNAESQIFSLATTRIGLEAQLLALQEQQTNYDIARINALIYLVNLMKGGGITTLDQLTAAVGTAPADIQSFLGLVTAGGIVNPVNPGPGQTFANIPNSAAGIIGTPSPAAIVGYKNGAQIPPTGGSTSPGLEDSLATLYNERGQAGSGGFTTEVL